MSRRASGVLAWVIVLLVGGSLAACGGDEHKNHKGYQSPSGDGK